MPDVLTFTNQDKQSTIRQLYSASIAKELVSFDRENAALQLKATAWCTNANYNMKKAHFICFINGLFVSP